MRKRVALCTGEGSRLSVCTKKKPTPSGAGFRFRILPAYGSMISMSRIEPFTALTCCTVIM